KAESPFRCRHKLRVNKLRAGVSCAARATLYCHLWVASRHTPAYIQINNQKIEGRSAVVTVRTLAHGSFRRQTSAAASQCRGFADLGVGRRRRVRDCRSDLRHQPLVLSLMNSPVVLLELTDF